MTHSKSAHPQGRAGEPLSERLGPLEVFDLRGGKVELRSLWRERPIVLVFLRHFG